MAPPPASPPAPRRVLIVRLSAIGDIIMASGLIPALRNLWPDAEIAWLAESSNAGLLRDNPRLTRLHLLPRARWRELRRQGQHRTVWREMAAFTRELREARYDLVLDLQGLLKSGVWTRATGAPRRIGLGSREGSQWLMTETVPRLMDDPRIGKEYRDLAVRLGADPSRFVMDIAIPDSVQQGMAQRLRAAGVSGNYAVLAPFTTRPQKHWFDERWTKLAERLSPTLTPVMLGGPGDVEHAAQLLSPIPGHVVNLTGQTSLIESAAIIRKARLLVGVDTGLTHLGSAFGVPTVALFGSTLPYSDTTRDNGKVLYEPHTCSPCHRRPSCGGEFSCMKALTVDAVLRTVETVMRNPSLSATPEH